MKFFTPAVFLALIAASMRGDFSAKRDLLDAQIKHRGKGRGTPSRHFGNNATDWSGRRTGDREASRRARQIANGQLNRESRGRVLLAQERGA